MRFSVSLILSTLLYTTLIVSIYSSPIVERVDISDYPKIVIQIREELNKPIETQKIIIKEKHNDKLETISRVDILKSTNNRPVRVFFVIQASSEEKNNLSRDIANSVLKNISNDDLLGLFIYGEEEMYFSDNLNMVEIKNKISALPVGKSNKIFKCLTQLAEKLPHDTIPTLLILISSDNASDSANPELNLSSTFRKKHIKIHSIMNEDSTAYQFSEKTGGKIYSNNDRLLVSNILTQITNIKKRPVSLEYESPFEDSGKELQSSKIEVFLEVGEYNYDLSYEVSLLSRIESKIQDVEFVYTVLFTTLLVCFLLFYSQLKSRARTEAMVKKQFLKNRHKADLYYHENNSFHEGNKVAILSTSALNDEEEDDFYSNYSNEKTSTLELNTPPPPELPRGKKYDTAFLIQKEGPNPGRQFNITTDEIEIGNSSKNDLILKDTTISHKHSKIKKINGSYYIFDQVSQRGTYVNGKKVLKPKPLSDFDEIRLGRTLLLFRGK